MSRLQRSSVSFRRQGSSRRIWDDDPLRGLDLKALSSVSTATTPKAAAAAAALHPDDDAVLAGDPSPGVVPRSLVRHSGASSAGVIVESPQVASGGGEREEIRPTRRRRRRRRRISSAFCACMGHPPASHAQQ